MRKASRIAAAALLVAALAAPGRARGQDPAPPAAGQDAAPPAAVDSAPAPKKTPTPAKPKGAGYDTSRWGGGFAVLLIPAHQYKLRVESGDTARDIDVELHPVTGGFSFFFEHKFFDLFKGSAFAPYLALGGEALFAFPRIDKYQSGNVYVKCDSCETDVFFALNLRVRIPFVFPLRSAAVPALGVYPLLGMGLSNYAARSEDDNTSYTGLDFVLGAGLELYAGPHLMPFFELRYEGAVGWNKNEEEYKVMGVTYIVKTESKQEYHALLIAVGLRVF